MRERLHRKHWRSDVNIARLGGWPRAEGPGGSLFEQKLGNLLACRDLANSPLTPTASSREGPGPEHVATLPAVQSNSAPTRSRRTSNLARAERRTPRRSFEQRHRQKANGPPFGGDPFHKFLTVMTGDEHA